MVAKVFTCRLAPPGGTHPVWAVTREQAAVLMRHLSSRNAYKIADDIVQVKDPTEFKPEELQQIPSEQFYQNGKRAREDLVGYVYAAFSKGNSVKVGMTCQENPMKRIRQLNTAVKHPFHVLDFIRCGNPAALETFLHEHLQVFSVGSHNRELFNVHPDYVTRLFDKIKTVIESHGLSEDDPVDISSLKVSF